MIYFVLVIGIILLLVIGMMLDAVIEQSKKHNDLCDEFDKLRNRVKELENPETLR
jgi:hypothetical protein